MARRERGDGEEGDDRRRSRLESVIPDLIKKAVQGGYDRATGAAETLNSFIGESKLPKEIVNAIFGQIDETKNGLFRVVAKEVRGFLEAVDFQRELQKLLTTVSFEIKTEIRFIPNDSMPEKLGRPQVKANMKVKRQRDREKPKTPREEREEREREEREADEREDAAKADASPEVPPPPLEDDDSSSKDAVASKAEPDDEDFP